MLGPECLEGFPGLRIDDEELSRKHARCEQPIVCVEEQSVGALELRSLDHDLDVWRSTLSCIQPVARGGASADGAGSDRKEGCEVTMCDHGARWSNARAG